MWTVTVVLPNGDTESYADEDRLGADRWDKAYAYTYEVDASGDVLRVFRQLYELNDEWEPLGSRREVAYYRPRQWDRVRAT